MMLRSPEAAQQTGFVIFLPLTFISSAFVPTQAHARLAAAGGGVEPDVVAGRRRAGSSSATRTRPRHGARLADAASRAGRALLVGGGMLVVFAPLAVRLYGSKVH